MKRSVEDYLGNDKKLYAAFMDLEKAYDRIDREALWSVLKVCGVGRQLLKGIQAFYRGTVVSTPGYESAGSGSNPGLGSQRTPPQLFIHPFRVG